VHVERRRDRYEALSVRLSLARFAYANTRRTQIGRARERVTALADRAWLAFDVLIQRRDARLERASRLLAAVSYRGVLARGFALVRDLDRKPLRNAVDINPGMHLDIEFADGNVSAMAQGSTPLPVVAPRPRRPRARRRNGDDENQGNLF
jgi:exodeoxyribonuclease VII large subunit